MRGLSLTLALVWASPAWAQVAPVIDNARVTVRDISLSPGAPPMTQTYDHDYVTLFLTGGTTRTNGAVVMHRAGDAVFHPAGTALDAAVSGHPRLVVVELKDTHTPPLINKTSYPLAFPRPAAKNVLENNKVRVWDYTWRQGKPTPMHYHDKDIVVIYLGEGTLDSVTPDGKHTPTLHHPGEIRFNKGDRSHYEVLTQGSQSAILMELK